MSTAPDLLSVAAAQYPLDPAPNFDAWAAKVERWVADGAATGARLLVFPEYGAIELAATRGVGTTADLSQTLAAVADLVEEASAIWRKLAARHGVFILAPSGPERRDGGFVNAARLVGPAGGIGVQDKLILTPFERDWGMKPSGSQRVFETPLGRIAIAICYDSEFPLLVRGLAEAGADLVLIPSCTEHPSGYHRVRTSAMARALENQIATVMAPTVGEAAWSQAVEQNAGAAGIFVPADVALSMSGVIAEGRLDVPGWVAGEIDLGRLRALRETGEMRNWRDWEKQPGAGAPSLAVKVVAVA